MTEPIYSQNYTEEVHARVVAAALAELEHYAAQQEDDDDDE